MNNLQLIKEAQSLMSSIFEVDYEGEKDKINPNKPEKKDKVDVVSVADELFPAGGTAKQQYNQKIINKINDMIEGKATLEDLIQLVRQKSAAKKAIATHECLDNAVELLEEMINEMKPAAYGSATGKREEMARQDVMREREAEEKYKKHKAEHPEDKEGLEKLAQEWNDIGSHNRLDKNSNVNKWSKDLARSKMKANSFKNGWSADQRAEWETARKKEVKTDIGNTPYKHMPRW